MTLTTKFLTLIKILVCLVLVIQIGHVKCGGGESTNASATTAASATTGDGQTSTNATVSSSVRTGQFYFGLFSLVTSLILAKIMD